MVPASLVSYSLFHWWVPPMSCIFIVLSLRQLKVLPDYLVLYILETVKRIWWPLRLSFKNTKPWNLCNCVDHKHEQYDKFDKGIRRSWIMYSRIGFCPFSLHITTRIKVIWVIAWIGIAYRTASKRLWTWIRLLGKKSMIKNWEIWVLFFNNFLSLSHPAVIKFFWRISLVDVALRTALE